MGHRSATAEGTRVTKRVDWLSLLCLGGAVLLWGTSFAAMKAALTGFQPMAVIWIRMTIGALLFAPFWHRLPKPDYKRGDWLWLLLLGLFEPCLYFLLEGYAIEFTTSAQAGMIASVVPLLVAVGAWLFLKERLSRLAIVGLVVSVAGVVVLTLAGAPAESAPAPALGNLLELAAMTSGAGYMLIAKRLSARYSPWILTGLQSVSGALFFIPGALLSKPETWFQAPSLAWGAALYLGCFVTLGGFGLYNLAVSRMDAGRAAMSINLIPVVAVIAGWLVLGESLTPLQGLGGLAVVGGVVLGEAGSPGRPPETFEPPMELAAEDAGGD